MRARRASVNSCDCCAETGVGRVTTEREVLDFVGDVLRFVGEAVPSSLGLARLVPFAALGGWRGVQHSQVLPALQRHKVPSN